MRILVDINHPAHVHLFKNAIFEWQARGDEVLITARKKEITYELLDGLGLPYIETGAANSNVLSYPFAVLQSDWRVFKAAISFRPDFLIGTSFAAAHVSKFVSGKSIVFAEDDFASNKLFWAITSPFVDFVVTPDTIKEKLGWRHIKYAGCQEMAYLHPKRFQADKQVLKKLNLKAGEKYSLVRLVSLGASHDKGQQGIDSSLARKIVDFLAQNGKVFISSERELEAEFVDMRLRLAPEEIHDLLAGAQIIVSDSQSMTVEAAILATPSIRINTFVGRIPVIENLEHEYALSYGFLPDQEEKIMIKLREIIRDPDSAKKWRTKADKYISEKVDLTKWMLSLLEDLHAKRQRKKFGAGASGAQ